MKLEFTSLVLGLKEKLLLFFVFFSILVPVRIGFLKLDVIKVYYVVVVVVVLRTEDLARRP